MLLSLIHNYEGGLGPEAYYLNAKNKKDFQEKAMEYTWKFATMVDN